MTAGIPNPGPVIYEGDGATLGFPKPVKGDTYVDTINARAYMHDGSGWFDISDTPLGRELLGLPPVLSRFNVIVADPNWKYKNFSDTAHGAAAAHYRGAYLDFFKKLPIKKLLADEDGCVLILWTTWPKLDEGMALLQAWGFEYVTGFPWIKILPKTEEIDLGPIVEHAVGEFFERVKLGMTKFMTACKKVLRLVKIKIKTGIGFWKQSTSEIVLIGRIGEPRKVDGGKIPQLGLLFGDDRQFYHPIAKHSKKPEGIQDWLEREFHGPMIELFATRNRPKWTCVGKKVGTWIDETGIHPYTGQDEPDAQDDFLRDERFGCMACMEGEQCVKHGSAKPPAPSAPTTGGGACPWE